MSRLAWEGTGCVVYDSEETRLEGKKGIFISNERIFDLAERAKRDQKHRFIKRLLGDADGIPGVVLLGIKSDPPKMKMKCYQVYCSWMTQWHLTHTDASLDIAYQDDGSGGDKMLSVIVRKKYAGELKSVSRLITEEELETFTTAMPIQKMAEDCLAKMDAQCRSRQ
jgi:hypothetical protein